MQRLFNMFSKDKDSSELKDILSIPYDYSSYDLVFEEGMTDPVDRIATMEELERRIK